MYSLRPLEEALLNLFRIQLPKIKITASTFLASMLMVSGFAQQSTAQNITDPALEFAIFAKENVTLRPNEIEGRVAAGGMLILDTGDSQIIPKISSGFTYGGIPVGLAVRGGVQLISGRTLQVNQGYYVKIGDSEGLQATYQGNTIQVKQNGGGVIHINSRPGNPAVDHDNNPVFENVFGTGPGQIDIDGAFEQLTASSLALGALVNNVSIGNRDNSGAPLLTGPFLTNIGFKPDIKLNPNAVNVLTIDAGVWSNLNEIFFSGLSENPNFALIINFLNAEGKTVDFKNSNLQNGKYLRYTVLNFPDVTGEVHLKGMVRGLVLAPRAQVTKVSNQNLVGQVIARSYVHNGDEMHYQPLIPNLFERALNVVTSTFCLQDAPYLEYEITSNFEMTGSKATIEWLTPDGTVVSTLTNQELSGRLLFPGAAVDENGDGTAWPGWVYQNGNWVAVDDLNSKLRLPGAKIRVTVNPVFVTEVSYPPSTDDCFTTPPPNTPPPLPVRLISFGVEEGEQQTALLRWAADNAIAFSHFDVERSLNGRDFVNIGSVPFSENDADYRFTDKPSHASTIYYRLKLVDLDGSFSHSRVESLRLAEVTGEVAYGYPNPFTSHLYVFSVERQNATVFDATGRQVALLNLEAGRNEINADRWPVGMYIIRTEGSRMIKILKQ